MEYIVRMKKEKDFENAKTAYINNNFSGYSYKPLSYAKVIYVIDKGFYIKLTSHEANPLARYTEFYSPVWTDSCLEFFVNFAPEKSNLYLNCEMNSAGGLLLGVGNGREGRVEITRYTDEIPKPEIIKTNDKWETAIFLSIELIYKIYGKFEIKNGYSFKGNFYKCGEDTPFEHYLTWNPVKTEAPDFHRPEYFGEFRISE